MTNKITWIVVVSICTPFMWLGIQNLVAQDQDPFGENSNSTPPVSQEDPFGELAEEPAESAKPASNPVTSEPTPAQVPDETDPFGEGGMNPIDEPDEMKGGQLPNANSPFDTDMGTEKTLPGETGQGIDSDPNSDPFSEMNSTTNPAAESNPSNQSQNTFAEGAFEVEFWRYLSANNYKNWAPAPNQNGDFYDGKSPHGIYLKMYLNRTAISSPEELPNGSVIVKENYGLDKSLKAITVMYRSTGYNPKGKDWYWVKYNPDGTVARTGVEEGSMKIAGASKSCIECHESADGDDYTFFND